MSVSPCALVQKGAPTQALIMVQGEASSVTRPAAASSPSRAAAYGMIKPRHGVMITGPLPVISLTVASCAGVSSPSGTATLA